jgi:hypothetical protein
MEQRIERNQAKRANLEADMERAAVRIATEENETIAQAVRAHMLRMAEELDDLKAVEESRNKMALVIQQAQDALTVAYEAVAKLPTCGNGDPLDSLTREARRQLMQAFGVKVFV